MIHSASLIDLFSMLWEEAPEIFTCNRILILDNVIYGASGKQLSTVFSSSRPQVDNMLGTADCLLIMLNYNYSISFLFQRKRVSRSLRLSRA